ncbi:MAG: penicillin-binding transpeptidase domain-containing protein [Acidobacteriota bacterium]|nr:penicillin-binding transpeptidase domain-containing protein [Acidobacteriota bacterium]
MPRWNLACAGLVVALVPMVSRPAPARNDSPALLHALNCAMAGQAGTALVLDVQSGGILAAYHPQVAAQRLAYPGSSIKPFTLLALLAGGKVDGHTTLMCKRTLTIAGHRLDCSHPATGEPLDPSGALAYSCNSYFTSVATRLTPQQLRDSFVREGFASVPGLTANEAAGSVALAHSPEELQLQAIGESGIRITPLELANAYRNLARSSVARGKDGAMALLFEGLQGSVAYGMARAAQPASAIQVAGKTGTATADEGAWTHGWFAGYAPANNPRIVVVVFLEKGHGSDAAGIARDVFAAFAAQNGTQP